MTLCISWKSADGRIHLAADSRVTFGGGQPADVAVKVAKLPYRITEVTHANDPRQVELLGEIGITFCGSTVSMFAIKEWFHDRHDNLFSRSGLPVPLCGAASGNSMRQAFP